jgi:putative transposase
MLFISNAFQILAKDNGSLLHFTPTYASWLNQVDIWFNRITQRALRRGTFSSLKELVKKIDDYVQNSNRHAQPFAWTATAHSIVVKVERLCERDSTLVVTRQFGSVLI